MSSSETEIANSALAKIRGRQILSFDDNSVEARTVRGLYHPLRKKLLRSHPWNFAIKRAELALLTEEPPYGRGNFFQVPADCLRILETTIPEEYDWTLEGDRILVDRPATSIRYIYDVTDCSRFDSYFCEVLAYSLAAEMAMTITNGATIAATLRQALKEELAQARSFDAQEGGSIRQVTASSWINARY